MSEMESVIDSLSRRYTKGRIPEKPDQPTPNLDNELSLSEALRADVVAYLDSKYRSVDRLLVCSTLADIAIERSNGCFKDGDDVKGWLAYWRHCVRASGQFLDQVLNSADPPEIYGGSLTTFCDHMSRRSPSDERVKWG